VKNRTILISTLLLASSCAAKQPFELNSYTRAYCEKGIPNLVKTCKLGRQQRAFSKYADFALSAILIHGLNDGDSKRNLEICEIAMKPHSPSESTLIEHCLAEYSGNRRNLPNIGRSYF